MRDLHPQVGLPLGICSRSDLHMVERAREGRLPVTKGAGPGRRRASGVLRVDTRWAQASARLDAAAARALAGASLELRLKPRSATLLAVCPEQQELLAPLLG